MGAREHVACVGSPPRPVDRDHRGCGAGAAQEIKPLTSLRFFFALWVVMRHLFIIHSDGASNYARLELPHFLNVFAVKGYLGVDAFFILSGLVLSNRYASELQNPTRAKFRKFIVARIARIYPIHLLTLCLVLIIYCVDILLRRVTPDGQYGFLAFLLNMMLMNAWYILATPTWNDVSWSLSAEWFAYLFFPLFLRYSSIKWSPVARLGLLIAVLVTIELFSGNHLDLPGGLIRLVPEFLIGTVICQIHAQRPTTLNEISRFSGLVAIMAVVLGVALSVDSLAVAGLAGLIWSQLHDGDLLYAGLSGRTFVYGGQISYCIYMTQRIVQRGFDFARGKAFSEFPASVNLILFLVVLIAVGAATYHLAEKPCRKWILARYRPAEAPQEGQRMSPPIPNASGAGEAV